MNWEQNKAELSMSCWAATLSKNKWQLVNEILRLQKLLIKQPAARASARALLRRPLHCTALKKESTAKAHCPELFLKIVKFLEAYSWKNAFLSRAPSLVNCLNKIGITFTVNCLNKIGITFTVIIEETFKVFIMLGLLGYETYDFQAYDYGKIFTRIYSTLHCTVPCCNSSFFSLYTCVDFVHNSNKKGALFHEHFLSWKKIFPNSLKRLGAWSGDKIIIFWQM